jgi:O-6-methylguanine DNA methyltransferase
LIQTVKTKACLNNHIFEFVIPTPDGKFVARYSETGLCELNFPSSQPGDPPIQPGPEPPQIIRKWHAQTVDALSDALTGRGPDRFPPLDLSAGSDFQQRVWRALLKIKNGETRSYGEVASAIGNAKAVRAVGGACGANPVPVLVPCHRVLAAHQKLGGFSSDMSWKKKLLAREGVRPADGWAK